MAEDSPSQNPIDVSFPHGLGDCVYFAHQIPLYTSRGHRFRVQCAPDKAFLFRACEGIEVIPKKVGFPAHSWQHGPSLKSVCSSNFFYANKAACNISRNPMPNIGLIDRSLWDEFCSIEIKLRQFASAEDKALISRMIEPLPRPIILLHTKGNTSSEAKDIDDDTTVKLYLELLDRTDGTLILLDWDQRVPKLRHGRVRHMLDDLGRLTVPQLVGLIDESDLVIGIDSGSGHVSRFTDTPTLIVWFEHHPGAFSLPRGNHAHLVPKARFHQENVMLRTQYNIIECEGSRVGVKDIAKVAIQMLTGPRYFDRAKLGSDVLLRQFIESWTNGGFSGNQRSFVDRHKSFSLLTDYLISLKRPFRMLETGTIRAKEDWRGAGYSTYLFSYLARELGGHLTSVDIEPAHCAFANVELDEFKDSLTITNENSINFIRNAVPGIDLLYLDSMDCYVEGHERHGLAEAMAGHDKVNPGGLIAFDDTVYGEGRFHGKGALGVPWLLERGFSIEFSGHQIILRKPS